MSNVRLKFTAEDVSGFVAAAIEGLSVPVAQAATGAIREAGDLLQLKGRVHIHNVGFSRKWENAYKVTVYPTRGNSIDAAAFGVFRRIPFSDIFATGGAIVGKPLLWLPLPTTPKIDRRKAAASVKDYARKGIKMFPINGGKRPLLAVTVMMTRSQASKKIVRVNLNDIQSGIKKTRSKSKNHLVRRTVPLFFGIPNVRIKRRFSWDTVQASVQNLVPALYDKYITRLADK